MTIYQLEASLIQTAHALAAAAEKPLTIKANRRACEVLARRVATKLARLEAITGRANRVR